MKKHWYFINVSFSVNNVLYPVPQETEAEIEDEVDILMSSDIVAAQMSTKQITFSRAQTGWIFRADKKVCVVLLVTTELSVSSVCDGKKAVLEVHLMGEHTSSV